MRWINVKNCYKCKQSKSLACFHKDKTRLDGLRHVCKECATTKQRKYADLHRDHYKELNKQHRENTDYFEKRYQNNKEDFAKYYQANQEKIKKQQAEYRKENKGLFNAKNAKRRALLINATPKWVDFKEIETIYTNCPEGYHVDHIVPLNNEMVCGLHVPWNLQYLPAQENLKKSNRL